MKFAYADPPYPGCAHLYPENKEVNHKLLIEMLCDEFPDGWALSTSSPALQEVLALCPEDVRIMAWVKPFCSFKPNVNPAYAWEPVLFRGGRKRTREENTVRDWVSSNITLKKGLVGAKPALFCQWLFEVLNIQENDEFVDLFPGTGIVLKELKRKFNNPQLFKC
tara:strand:- start:45 stop:539 length:495 start_codon:yes stop_codon:yes gene_type:complete